LAAFRAHLLEQFPGFLVRGLVFLKAREAGLFKDFLFALEVLIKNFAQLLTCLEGPFAFPVAEVVGDFLQAFEKGPVLGIDRAVVEVVAALKAQSKPVDDAKEIKYSLSNAQADCSTNTLAQRQAQRHFVERSLQNAKSELGMSHYQVRLWKGWHHHMTLVCLAMLFVLEEQLLQQEHCPLLSYYDVIVLLNFLLPKRKVDLEGLIEQMAWRHYQRAASIQTKRKKILKALYES